MSLSKQAGINLPGYDPLRVANAPTIGTATAGSSNCASVTFTAPACVGGGAISSYTVFANCGTKTASGASSPISVTGLSSGTSYTFKVMATNVYGQSYPSAASNSITAKLVGQQAYTTAGTYTWVAPANVTSVSVVAVGGGGGGGGPGLGGAGGGLGYKNNVTVTPGNSYTVVVGAAGVQCGANGGNSSFNSTTAVGNGGTTGVSNTGGGTYSGDGGGNGGKGATSGSNGGAGAGGYAGDGGYSVDFSGGGSSTSGAGGGGGGGGYNAGGGGGVGILGQGSNGAGATSAYAGGGGGSGGATGTSGASGTTNRSKGGDYGGGAGYYGNGGVGAVRIIWPGNTRSFPSTCTGNL